MTSTPDQGRSDDLVRRLEEAEVGSRELDAAIWAYFQGLAWVEFSITPGGHERIAHSGNLRFPDWLHPSKLTTSLDAALALVERVLPGEWIEISGPRKYLHIPTPVPNRWRAECGTIAWGATPALAICIAILRAKEASHG